MASSSGGVNYMYPQLACAWARFTMPGVIAGKPVIGIVGGIGSGKSFVADLFAELGCFVSKSDEDVRQAYRRPEVIRQVQEWWGDKVITSSGEVDRSAVASIVFGDSGQLKRLESLLHPLVQQIRDAATAKALENPQIKAIVWDTPLLYEVGLHKQCDAVVFVEATADERAERVASTRGWRPQELIRREKSQLPLDNKRKMAQYIVYNTADAAHARRQVVVILSRVLTQTLNADPLG